ncbi:MAG: polymer-forming cytoskeletal protein, partial [Pseudomonadales bacterium]
MIGTMVGPAPVSALEVRRDAEVVTIARSETIDDTVLVAAETVLIEGVITGDLVAVGRRIDISGSVEGNVLTFAESVTVSGKVGGFALGAASSYDLRGATVGGDLWVASEMVGIDSNTRVERNATIAAQSTSVEGYVAKDLYAFAETVELSGDVGEDLEAFANRVRLLGEAHVGGNVRFRSGNEDRLHRAATVRVDGEVEFLDMPEGF